MSYYKGLFYHKTCHLGPAHSTNERVWLTSLAECGIWSARMRSSCERLSSSTKTPPWIPLPQRFAAYSPKPMDSTHWVTCSFVHSNTSSAGETDQLLHAALQAWLGGEFYSLLGPNTAKCAEQKNILVTNFIQNSFVHMVGVGVLPICRTYVLTNHRTVKMWDKTRIGTLTGA